MEVVTEEEDALFPLGCFRRISMRERERERKVGERVREGGKGE